MATQGKKGVLLVNLGTPDAPTYGAVYRYLKEFLMDRRVIDINPIARNLLVKGFIAPFRSKPSSDLYKQVWTEEGSPLKVFGYKLEEGVQEILGDEYVVKLAMRYQSPSIETGLEALRLAKVSEIIIFPLFPQYSSCWNIHAFSVKRNPLTINFSNNTFSSPEQNQKEIIIVVIIIIYNNNFFLEDY